MSKADPTKCGAVRNGKTCKNAPGFKTPHPGVGPCHLHTGNTRTQITAAERVIARQECERLGVPIQMDPYESLLFALYESNGLCEWLRLKVEAEAADAGDEPVSLHDVVKTSGENWSKLERKESIYWRMYQDERKHQAQLAAACIKAGIAERQVSIAERQAQMIATVIQAVLDDPAMALTTEQRQTANQVVPTHLRLISSEEKAS